MADYGFSHPNLSPAEELELIAWQAAAGLDTLVNKVGVNTAIGMLKPYGYGLDGDHAVLAKRRVVKPAAEEASRG